jgi:uncharacterized protein
MSDEVKPTLSRELSEEEQRVLGCLVEKAATTPEQYPLTMNSLRLACNQKTSRDPVVNYEERTVGIALRNLMELKLAKEIYPSDRGAVKYEHRFGQALDLRQPAVAVLAVLLLRGAQTGGEIRQNAHRLHEFETLGHLDDVLERLEARGMLRKLARGPGQREDRYVHLLGPCKISEASFDARESSPRGAERAAETRAEIDALRTEINELREAHQRELADLRQRIEALETLIK